MQDTEDIRGVRGRCTRASTAKRRWHTVVVFLVLLICVSIQTVFSPVAAQSAEEEVGRRYSVMAAFLYNFLMFIEWPASPAFEEGPVLIGVLGENPFGEATAAIEQKTLGGREIEFRFFPAVENLRPTQILFVSKEFSNRMSEISRAVGETPILTVGESETFTRDGGVIRFYQTPGSDKLQVEINQTAAQRIGFQIRSQLLRLASVVEYPVSNGKYPGKDTMLRP